MGEYLVRSTFMAKTPAGARMMMKGEALRLSTSQAVPLTGQGLVIDANVGTDLLGKFETRIAVLIEQMGYSRAQAQAEAGDLVMSCMRRHESLKTINAPTEEFIVEVEAFNLQTEGENPVGKEASGKGVGEWAGFRCNIGKGCSHGCLYCYAEKMAARFGRVESSEAWRKEYLRDVSTANCKQYDSAIMFPTSHDITPTYLAAYRCHLYNLVKAGNKVLVVSKPHRECIESLVKQFSAYRDQVTFRFTIGSLDQDAMQHWEPGAPTVAERIGSLKMAFESGYTTSVSAEPMLGSKEDAVKLYYLLEPFVTHDIWFGKMNNIGGLRSSTEPEVAKKATELMDLQSDKEMLALVDLLGGLPKVRWKDSVKSIIAKHKEK